MSSVTIESSDAQKWVEKNASKLVTAGELATAMRVIGKLARELEDRIAAVEAQAESFAEFGYVGVHVVERQYRSGNIVTHRGAMWHCNRITRATPGTCSDWTLCVKSGQ